MSSHEDQPSPKDQVDLDTFPHNHDHEQILNDIEVPHSAQENDTPDQSPEADSQTLQSPSQVHHTFQPNSAFIDSKQIDQTNQQDQQESQDVSNFGSSNINDNFAIQNEEADNQDSNFERSQVKKSNQREARTFGRQECDDQFKEDFNESHQAQQTPKQQEQISKQATSKQQESNENYVQDHHSADSMIFSQFLNDVIDSYRSTTRAFISIDKHNKGFIEFIDLSSELASRFGIEDENKQHEIFDQLAKNSSQINRETFDEAFNQIMNERKRQSDQLFESMNVVVMTDERKEQNLSLRHQSPFKDQGEREEVLGIFAKSSGIDLAQDQSKVNGNADHFQEDSLYAPVIKKLRSQPNFNEFVRSYNSMQIPKPVDPTEFHSPQSLNNAINHQQTHQNHLNQFFMPEFSSTQTGFINFSPNRSLKNTHSSGQTFSPNRFKHNFAETAKESQFYDRKALQYEQQKSNNNTISPEGFLNARKPSPQQFTRSSQSFLGFDIPTISQIRSSGASSFHSAIQQNPSFPRSNYAQFRDLEKSSGIQQSLGSTSPLFISSSVGYSGIRSTQSGSGWNTEQALANTVGHFPSQLNYFSSQIQQQEQVTPNQQRLSKLKRKVTNGLESLQKVHNREYQGGLQRNKSNSSSNSSKAMQDIFNQYMSNVGFQTVLNPYQTSKSTSQISRPNYPMAGSFANNNSFNNSSYDGENPFSDILNKIETTESNIQNNNLRKQSNSRLRSKEPWIGTNIDSHGSNSINALKNQHGSPFRKNSSRKSRSPSKGVQNQMQRVLQIQAQLRSIPQKKEKEVSPVKSTSFKTKRTNNSASKKNRDSSEKETTARAVRFEPTQQRFRVY